MTREFPMISEFRSDSPTCPKGWNGCAVATTEALIRRYLPGQPVPNQVDLGDSMGRRHRQMDHTSSHGICPGAWCPYCSYLELKARGIPAKEAEALLIQAFVGEAVEGIEHAGLRDALIDRVVAWLKARE